MKTIKLYFRFLAVHLKTAMAYKGSFILSCIGQLLITANVFLGVKFLLDRFGSVGGYYHQEQQKPAQAAPGPLLLMSRFHRFFSHFVPPYP